MSDITLLRIAQAKQSRLRLLDEDICILHAGDTDYVLGFNASSALLMDLIIEFPNSDETVLAEYAKALEIDTEMAAEFISMQVKSWCELKDVFQPLVQINATPPSTPPLLDVAIAFGGNPVRLMVHDATMLDFITPLILGLEVDADLDDLATVEAFRNIGKILISCNDGRYFQGATDLLARGEIITALVEAAFPKCLGIPHLHGATLVSPEGKLLLITGDSGQGKTTLALGLAALGYSLLSDDISLFDPNNSHLIPIQFNPSVKQGAWTALDPHYPQLTHITPTRQGDRYCKYIPRSTALISDFTGQKADLILFPNWSADAEPSLLPYDNKEAILSLLRHSHLPKNEENLQTMIDFLCSQNVMELSYSSFEAAKTLIDQALK